MGTDPVEAAPRDPEPITGMVVLARKDGTNINLGIDPGQLVAEVIASLARGRATPAILRVAATIEDAGGLE